MDRQATLIAALTAVIIAVALPARAQTLNEVLDRVGRYLDDYQPRIDGLVADEEYEQVVRRTSSYGGGVAARRKLSSEFFVVKLPDGEPWYGVRDPYRVDGKPITTDRIEPLLREGSDEAYRRAVRIAHENARYNIGSIYRTINLPFQVLQMLHPSRRSKFTYSQAGKASIGGRSAWKIDFLEVTRPSLITTGLDGDLLARGSAWVDPESGAVLKTELRLGGDESLQIPSVITVDYSRDPHMQLVLPVEMREEYTFYNQVLRGRASYRNYRRFETGGRLIPNP